MSLGPAHVRNEEEKEQQEEGEQEKGLEEEEEEEKEQEEEEEGQEEEESQPTLCFHSRTRDKQRALLDEKKRVNILFKSEPKGPRFG